MKISRLAVAGAVLTATASPAFAVTTTYTSQAAFDAAVSGETSFGFDEGDTSDHFHVASNPYTQSGITFTDDATAPDAVNGGTPILFLVGSAATKTYGVDFLSFQNTDVGLSAGITASGITALGFDYASYIVDGAATIAVNGGAPIALAVSNVPSFIGFTSSTPITSLSILFPTGYSFDLTHVSYGAAIDATGGAVPEPTSWAMFIGGLGLIGASMRRQRTALRPA